MSQFVVTSVQLKRWAIALRHGLDAVSYNPVAPFVGEPEREAIGRSMEEIKRILAAYGETIPEQEKNHEH